MHWQCPKPAAAETVQHLQVGYAANAVWQYLMGAVPQQQGLQHPHQPALNMHESVYLARCSVLEQRL